MYLYTRMTAILIRLGASYAIFCRAYTREKIKFGGANSAFEFQ